MKKSRLLIVALCKGKKCPKSRKPCLMENCAFWTDAGLRQVYSRTFTGESPAGYCQL